MLVKLKKSFKNINYKLFIALLFMGLCPTIYNTLRVFWLGEMPGEYSYSIAGQLSWVNLIYEIINEAIILPLFYFMGQALTNKKEFTNRIKTGLLITLIIYLFLSAFLVKSYFLAKSISINSMQSIALNNSSKNASFPNFFMYSSGSFALFNLSATS